MPLLSDRYLFRCWLKRFALFFFDAVGAVFFAASKPKQPLDTSKLRRILLIRTDQLGDVLMVRPAAAALKKHFPDVAIDLLCDRVHLALFVEDPFFDRLIGMDATWFSRKKNKGSAFVESLRLVRTMRQVGYDAAIDFRGDLRHIFILACSGIPERIGYGVTGGGFLLTRQGRYEFTRHQVLLNMELLRFFGIENPSLTPLAFRSSDEEQRAFWQGAGLGLEARREPLFIFHFGAGLPEKMWESTKCRELLKRVAQENSGKIVLVGTEEEKQHVPVDVLPPGSCDLRGQTSLRDLIILFSRPGIFIGMDSGPAHIAAAQGMSVVSIFKGPNDPAVWHPWTERLYQVTHPRECPATIAVVPVVDAIRKAVREFTRPAPFAQGSQP